MRAIVERLGVRPVETRPPDLLAGPGAASPIELSANNIDSNAADRTHQIGVGFGNDIGRTRSIEISSSNDVSLLARNPIELSAVGVDLDILDISGIWYDDLFPRN